MKGQIILEINTASGVHLRVMGVLKRNGMRMVNLAMQEGASGGKRLSLEVESEGGIDLETVYGQLLEVEGVVEVERFGKEPSATASKTRVAHQAPELTEAEKRFRNADSEAGDEEIRDRMLIFSLLSRYPKISGRLVELKGTIPVEDHGTRFHQIGVGFGRHLVGNLKLNGAVNDLDGLFDELLIPAVDPLARVVRIGDLLRVDVYRKEFDRGRPDPLHCRFIHGTLQGLLKGTETVPGFQVRKVGCMHREQARCEFRFGSTT